MRGITMSADRSLLVVAVAFTCAITGCAELSSSADVVPDASDPRRVGLEEATELVQAELLAAKPARRAILGGALTELTTDEMWRRLGVQLFKVDRGGADYSSYLIQGGRASLLGSGFGGHGVQSVCVSDLDQDGAPELVYTYSWGSGVHRSLVGLARVQGGELVTEEAPIAFVGDLFVRKEADSRVTIEIGHYRWSFSTWTPVAPLGQLMVSPAADRLNPRVELAELSSEHAKAVWRTPDEAE